MDVSSVNAGAVPAHTPGPWTYYHTGWLVYAGKLIADCGRSGELSPDEMRANANLIAAAPDLLAALKRLLSATEQNLGDIHDAEEQARAAIAKATGGAA